VAIRRDVMNSRDKWRAIFHAIWLAIDDWRDNPYCFQRQRSRHLSCVPRSRIFRCTQVCGDGRGSYWRRANRNSQLAKSGRTIAPGVAREFFRCAAHPACQRNDCNAGADEQGGLVLKPRPDLQHDSCRNKNRQPSARALATTSCWEIEEGLD